MAASIVDESFTVYPTGLSADQIVVPDRISVPTEQVIFDTDECAFIILKEEADNMWGYTLKCYLENKTDRNLMFSWDNVSVNGYMVDPFWAADIAPHARMYTGISFMDSSFDENGIEDVEEIEFTIRVHDADDWMADNVLEQTFTYKP